MQLFINNTIFFNIVSVCAVQVKEVALGCKLAYPVLSREQFTMHKFFKKEEEAEEKEIQHPIALGTQERQFAPGEMCVWFLWSSEGELTAVEGAVDLKAGRSGFISFLLSSYSQ